MWRIKLIFLLIKILIDIFLVLNQNKIIKVKNYIKKLIPFLIKILIISFLITYSYNFHDNKLIIILYLIILIIIFYNEINR